MNEDLLSPREQEVMNGLMMDLSAIQIAQNLGIKETTVRFHLTHIYKKLGVNSRAAAVRELLMRGLT